MHATATRLAPETRWECPNCDFEDVTREAQPHTRFHHCPHLGLTAPMVHAGTRCKIETVARQDYIGSDLVRRDDHGRPVSAIVTTTDHARDVIAFAGCATAKVT